jgi:hypothetical protein
MESVSSPGGTLALHESAAAAAFPAYYLALTKASIGRSDAQLARTGQAHYLPTSCGCRRDNMTFDAWTPALKRLVVIGSERGYVTVGELNAALPSDGLSSEMLEGTMAMLSDVGIDLVAGHDTEDGEAVSGNPRKPLTPLPLHSGAEAPLDDKVGPI